MRCTSLPPTRQKYGALSQAEGKINIVGTLDGENARRLTIEWRETGGPEVTPPAQRGFGTCLIQDGLVYELDAEVDIDYAPTGLACTIELALAATGALSPRSCRLAQRVLVGVREIMRLKWPHAGFVI
jgi:hypothetical protein